MNVAVVINDNSPESQHIGEYYAHARGLPARNILRIKTATDDTIDRATFDTTIDQPLAGVIAREGLQDRLLYLVLTKGVPLRIAGTGGVSGTSASVDSELTLLYRRMVGDAVPAGGRIDNPYYLGDRPLSEARRFTHRDYDMFLVSRLDAFTEAQALALVDRAGAAAAVDGKVVLDQRAPLFDRSGEDWFDAAASRLDAMGAGARVLLEKTSKPARGVSPVLGYFSWGSIDPQNRVRAFGMGFVPGALASTLVSGDARTFHEPPAEWVPSSDPSNQRTWYAGGPGTLLGDLIREGVTGAAGYVGDPFLQSAVRPQILFPAYLAGFNLIEAFYLSMPHVSWQTVVVGDPLCDPFGKVTLSRGEIESGTDATTGLPTLFSKRRIARVAAKWPGVPLAAVSAFVAGESQLVRRERAAARQSFEKATSLAPAFADAGVQLAGLDMIDGRYDDAIKRYQQVLQVRPNTVDALNNLAFLLAVVRHQPTDAQPLARRALTLAPRDPNVLDTAGWIEHLLGHADDASKLLGRAVSDGPVSAEIHLHAAVAFAASGARAVAEQQLADALRLDPSIDGRPEVLQVRRWLEANPSH